MKRPAISILTPTYNRAHVLHRVYDSLNRQKTRDFEWVVVDDGSTDGTPALLERWQAEADFPISWYRYENNRGRNAAVNSGAKLVSGKYSWILDSDDELLDDALETVADWRERTGVDDAPSVSGLYFRCVDESGIPVGRLRKGGGSSLPRETVRMSIREARYRLGMTFEFADVMKTEIFRDRRFVELTNSEHGPKSSRIWKSPRDTKRSMWTALSGAISRMTAGNDCPTRQRTRSNGRGEAICGRSRS